jgi:hypothetical protein
MVMKNIISIILITCSLQVVFAQKVKTIQGIVIAADDSEPLIGVNIFLNENWDFGTITNLEGLFSISIPIKALQDTVVFSYVGHEEVKLPVSAFGSGKTHEVVLVQNIKTIVEVVIRAERLIAEEFTLKKVRKIEIYKNPNAKADPLLAVNSMPAATTTDESANISLRGSGPEETGIFFNNVPIYDAVRFSQLNGIGTFSIFNTTIVKDLSVFPGNPPLEYGNTTSGLIAINSEAQVPKENVYSVAASLASVGMTANIKTGKKSSLIAFSNYGPSAIITGINQEALKDIKKFTSLDLGLHYYNQLNETTQFKIFNYTIKESYDFNLQNPTFYGLFEQRKLRNFTIGNFRKTMGKSEWTVNSGYSFSKTNFNFSKSDINIDNQDVFGSMNYQYYGEKLGLKTGLSYDGRAQDFEGTFAQYSFASGLSHPTIRSSNQERNKVFEYYGYAKYYITKSWIVGGGYRKNIPNTNQKHYLSYQLNVFHQPNENWNIKASIGHYNKYTFAQNQDSDGFLIGSKQGDINLNRKGKRVEHNVAVFLKKTDVGDTDNNVLGVEYFMAGNITSKLKGRISYTYINAEITDNQESFPSPYDLNYFVKGNLEYQLNSNWTLNTTFLFRQGSFYQQITGASFRSDLDAFEPSRAELTDQIRYPNYNLIDLSISRLFPIQEDLVIIAFASMSNVFDFKNVRNYSYNFDYSQNEAKNFSRRLVYFGAVINF